MTRVQTLTGPFSRPLLRVFGAAVLFTSLALSAQAQQPVEAPTPGVPTTTPAAAPAPAVLPPPVVLPPPPEPEPVAPAPASAAPATPSPLPAPAASAAPPEKPSHFFDHINVRGYTQLRYNQFLANNERLVNIQGDRSMGNDAGLLFRRARLVLSGDIHPQVAMYLQLDAAATAGDTQNVAQMRDWYFDVAADADKEFRLRVGQSKVPFGFENPQSSQNRLPMDRSDALNSAAAGERDLGLFAYYAPKSVRAAFKHLVESGLKGSGDYGMLAVGVYEGQTINLQDTNKNKHVVARASVPFQIGEQWLEGGVSAYTGKYLVRTDEGITSTSPEDGVRDWRAEAHFVIYPQPIGLQVEYNIGEGPELGPLTAATDADGETTYTGVVSRQKLHGGYALLSLKLDNVIPFVRIMNYEGGKKHERNAPSYSIKEIEAGIEWQVIKALELTAAFTVADRTDGGRIPYLQEEGHLLRLQAQFNY